MKPKRQIEKTEYKSNPPGINQHPAKHTTLGAPINPPCKTCKKNLRRNGSAYCQQCTNKHFKGILES